LGEKRGGRSQKKKTSNIELGSKKVGKERRYGDESEEEAAGQRDASFETTRSSSENG